MPPPPGMVRLGSPPVVQVWPPSPDRANTMLDDPPSTNRPDWVATTMVLPKENESGSTWVACWLVGLV